MSLRVALRPLLAAAALAICAAGAAAPLALAAPPASLTSAQQAMVDRATAYIQDLHTVKGRFVQTDANGQRSSGEFYMQRPGKARFEYDPPAQLLVVSDGHNVSVYDRRLKSFDSYPLGATPLVLLLAREVRLDRGVTVTAVDTTPDGFSITARDARKQADGRLTLQFGDDPVRLEGWTVVDAQGQTTHVQLGELTPVSGLDTNLFVLRDPRARGFGRP